MQAITTRIRINQAPAGWQTNLKYVYIGRAGQGQDGYFGNPISHKSECSWCGKIHGLPGATLECYERYLEHRLTFDIAFGNRFCDLKDKILVCPGNCKVGCCHGDIIIKYLDIVTVHRS